MADFPTTGDDVIFGSFLGETIDALLGNDTVFGGGGFDRLIGNGGDDQLSGGAGRDSLEGGKGSDTAYYTLAFDDVFASLELGYGYLKSAGPRSDKDSYTSIENLSGGQGNDELFGNAGKNKITGNGGDDHIEGGDGDDTLIGWTGIDTILGGAGNDKIDAGDGGDFIYDQGGSDRNDGGAGVDGLIYLNSDAAVAIDLAAGSASGGFAEGDKNLNIENITGSNFDDVLKGDGGNNILAGRNGDDVMSGRGGEDTLYGFDGADVLKGGAGFDRLYGSQGQDTLTGGLGADHFSYTSTDDSNPFMPDADVITDFTQGEDKISVFEIDANSATAADDDFIFRGTQQYLDGVAGQIRVTYTGGITVVSFQTDTIGTDMFIVLEGKIELTEQDFLL